MIKHPFGAAEVLTPTYAATLSVAVKNMRTQLNLGTMTGNCALTIVPDAELEIGAILTIKVKSDATARDVTFAAGVTAATIAGVISKTKTLLLEYNGSTFQALALPVQID